MFWLVGGGGGGYVPGKQPLLLIFTNFTPKTSHSCLKKWHTMCSRLLVSFWVDVLWNSILLFFGGYVLRFFWLVGFCGVFFCYFWWICS